MPIIKISIDELFTYLTEKDKPVEELELIRKFTYNDTPDSPNISLFCRHFSLYHALYRLKFTHGTDGYYTHLDPMRIRCLPVPDNNSCHHYDPETGKFCCKTTAGYACDDHKNLYESSRFAVLQDILSGFYIDAENIAFGDSEIFRKYMESLNFYILNKKEIDKAHKLFGIDKPDKKSISAKYRELANMVHPDKAKIPDDFIKELNAAYAILKRIYF